MGNKLENSKCLGLCLVKEVLTSWNSKISGATVKCCLRKGGWAHINVKLHFFFQNKH